MIVGAMEDVELDLLKEKLEDARVEETPTHKYYLGRLENHDVVLCPLGPGMLNSAIGVMQGIERYKPSAVIMTGIAGGYGKNIHKGDIVVSDEIINNNSILTEEMKIGEGSNPLEWKLIDFSNDKEPVIKTDSKLLECAKSVDYMQGKKIIGRIGSGDVWNRESDRIEYLSKKYSILCEEMEGYAAAYVCQKYNVPFIDVRAISNNELLKEEYDRGIGKKSQEFTLNFIKNIKRYL